ncbi:hypothetical protein JQX13_02610 [Archangium violaceum]|uniref:MXAN_6652 family MXYO-CTERM-anchored protein n=1 Tax=Archangium violaceum TaxID=83451 RepID=UPI00193BE2D5|nr:MXAN_6652 family MXYO-CTERM-anchored protein [Archangium violaceum]QRK09072.1 hypothetical protein JQX13_02610 [Archangium violaceum]
MKFSSYGAAGVLSLCLLSSPALANSTGMTGYSGKTSTQTCSFCHTGGSAPTVEIEGPTSIAAGATQVYKLIIRGGPGQKGGFNVAVDNAAASLRESTGTKKVGDELTHSAPRSPTSGEIIFDFLLVAPQTGGKVTIFGAGNSVNGDGNSTLDGAATTSLTVNITGGSSGDGDGNGGGGDGGGDDDNGGCSTTGGSPVMLLSLIAGGMTLLRRRRD